MIPLQWRWKIQIPSEILSWQVFILGYSSIDSVVSVFKLDDVFIQIVW